jgi:hypothetical protein
MINPMSVYRRKAGGCQSDDERQRPVRRLGRASPFAEAPYPDDCGRLGTGRESLHAHLAAQADQPSRARAEQQQRGRFGNDV